MAKTAEDCALILEYVAGQDPYDATSSPHKVQKYTQKLIGNIKEIKIGIPKEFFGQGLDPEIKKRIF